MYNKYSRLTEIHRQHLPRCEALGDEEGVGEEMEREIDVGGDPRSSGLRQRMRFARARRGWEEVRGEGSSGSSFYRGREGKGRGG
jgi:hypothetical protein